MGTIWNLIPAGLKQLEEWYAIKIQSQFCIYFLDVLNKKTVTRMLPTTGFFTNLVDAYLSKALILQWKLRHWKVWKQNRMFDSLQFINYKAHFTAIKCLLKTRISQTQKNKDLYKIVQYSISKLNSWKSAMLLKRYYIFPALSLFSRMKPRPKQAFQRKCIDLIGSDGSPSRNESNIASKTAVYDVD